MHLFGLLHNIAYQKNKKVSQNHGGGKNRKKTQNRKEKVERENKTFRKSRALKRHSPLTNTSAGERCKKMRESIENTPEKVEKEEESKKIESIAYFLFIILLIKWELMNRWTLKWAVNCKILLSKVVWCVPFLISRTAIPKSWLLGLKG